MRDGYNTSKSILSQILNLTIKVSFTDEQEQREIKYIVGEVLFLICKTQVLFSEGNIPYFCF